MIRLEVKEYTISLGEIIEAFDLEAIYMPEGGEERVIDNANVNRAGLQAAGFFDFYDHARVQVIGKLEHTYIEKLPEEFQRQNLMRWFELGMPALVMTRNLKVGDMFIELAKKYGVPVLRTGESTSVFITGLIGYLRDVLAPRLTMHGVLIEVYGVGVLIVGESGIGKSETALGLIRRYHRLIADDAVEIKKVAPDRLIGNAPPVIKHFMEIRGVGIIDIKNIFGISGVKDTKSIDLVVRLEEWKDDRDYDRLGMDSEYIALLDVEVPEVVIPVRPGRDLSTIIEIAALNSQLKETGHNAAQELNRRLLEMGEENI